MQTKYKIQGIRSPYQLQRSHPAQMAQEKGADTLDSNHPARQMMEKLCRSKLDLSATWSLDISTMEALQTPGLIAVTCELSLKNKGLIGIGHGSTVISKINRGLDRALLGSLNGALTASIFSACKTLDVMRLEDTNTLVPNNPAIGEAYRAAPGEAYDSATPKQLDYLRQLLQLNVEDESEREQWMANLDSFTKEEASAAIKQFAR